MGNIENKVFLTIRQQKILLLLYDKRIINFKEQDIFSNQQWFRKEMQKLINFGAIRKINSINPDMRKGGEAYKISLKGIILVESLINDFDEKNR